MDLLGITLNLESIKTTALLLESKFSILLGHLSPNTILGLKCVLGIWALIIAGNLIIGLFELVKKIYWRSRKIKPYREAIKDERHLT